MLAEVQEAARESVRARLPEVQVREAQEHVPERVLRVWRRARGLVQVLQLRERLGRVLPLVVRLVLALRPVVLHRDDSWRLAQVRPRLVAHGQEAERLSRHDLE